MPKTEASDRSLLVVGWSKVGKTVLAVQLILRTQKGKGQLTFRKPPPNLTLVETATADLSEGRAPGHTPANVLSDLTLPLTGPVDLVWPDYGGEQVRKMVGQKRRLPEGWRERVEAAGGWLLMIRPGRSPDFEDILTRPLPDLVSDRRTAALADGGTTGGKDEANEGEYDPSEMWSDQSLLIEILQILREVRGPSAFRPNTAPVLAIALSCWDELYPDPESDPTPEEVLRSRYPLLHSFVEANWAEERRVVYGLSAQGQDLSEVADEAYAAKGPEEHGYIVDPSGERDEDLTALISDIIRRIEP